MQPDLKPEVDPEVGEVALIVALLLHHRHPLVEVGLGDPLAGEEELVEGRGVPVPEQLDAALTQVHHTRGEEDEGAHLGVERVPRVVQLARHLGELILLSQSVAKLSFLGCEHDVQAS